MIDNNNILLITDDEETAAIIARKLVLLRNNDKISVCPTSEAKRVIRNSLYKVIIIHDTGDPEYTIKLISAIKAEKSDAGIILLLDYINSEFIIRAYDNGIYDYITADSDEFEILIKAVNCLKMQVSKDIQKRNEKFLYQLGVIDEKTGLYKDKYLRDIFIDISDDLGIQNGVFTVLSLDPKIKTKVSTNRLGCSIKASVRGDDVIAATKNGCFYMILQKKKKKKKKNLIEKIQEKMGQDFPIRSGLVKIGNKSFETLDKDAKDGLTSALQNDIMAVCLGNNINPQQTWLDDEDQDNNTKKNFKLFKAIFTNKMDSIITPLFYRFQKDYEIKLSNTKVSQYTNKVESVFCLKNDNLMSELVIRYNGYAKFSIEINHSGLDSAENYEAQIPLAQMTEKYLSGMLKRLKDEYKSSMKIIKEAKKGEAHA